MITEDARILELRKQHEKEQADKKALNSLAQALASQNQRIKHNPSQFLIVSQPVPKIPDTPVQN